MPRKHKLSSSTSTYHVLGITCNRKPFQVALRLNKTLKLDLRRLNDLSVYYENLAISKEFQFFGCLDESKKRTYCLVYNRNDDSLLLNDYKSTDFFLVIDGLLPDAEIKPLVDRIKAIENVVLAYHIKPLKGPDAGYFFNAIEDYIDSNPA